MMRSLLRLPWKYTNLSISYATKLALPPDLSVQMELAEQARMGEIDVSKLYRPALKIESFVRYFEVRNFVLVLYIKFVLMTIGMFISGFKDPGVLEYFWGSFCLYLFLLVVRKNVFDLKTLNFVLTLTWFLGDSFSFYHQTHVIPPVLSYLPTFLIMPLVAFHIMREKEAAFFTVLVLARFAYSFHISVGNTYTITIEDPSTFAFVCLISHLYPIYVLKTFDSDMRIFHSLLAKFVSVSEDRSKEKTAFISRMSHELRTPLHGLLSSASLIRETPITEEQNAFLSTIDSCGEVILDVIVKILDITKIEAGDFEKTLGDFSLFDLMKNLSESVLSIAEAKNLELTVLFEPHPQGYDVRGDKVHLREIMMNLVGNAIKYTDFGSVTIRVSRQNTGWRHFSHYLFEILDTGRGIPPGELETIFAPFKQVHDQNNKKHEGSGLGLSIAKKLAEALDGEIGVKSALGSGSLFWVKLPLEPLAPGLFYPPLDQLPRDVELLSNTAGYFGVEAPFDEGLNLEGLTVATDLKDRALEALSFYFNTWGVRLVTINNPKDMGEFLSRGGSMVVLEETANLSLFDTAAKQYSRTLRIIIMTSITNFVQTNQAASAAAGTSLVRVLMKPYEPLKLYQGLLFLLGSDACLRSPGDPLPGNLSPIPVKPDEGLPPLHLDTIDVLVVEDNPVNQLIMKKILERLNVKFRITPSGEKALEIWKGATKIIPLVFMDVEVEGSLNGLQVTSILRDWEREKQKDQVPEDPRYKRSHVVVLTGRAMESDRQEAMLRGCDEFVTKPVNVNLLQSIIKKHLPIGGE